MCEYFKLLKNYVGILCNDQDGLQRTGVVEKHCSVFAPFFHKHTNKVQVSKRPNERRIKGGSTKLKTEKIEKIGDPHKFHPTKIERTRYRIVLNLRGA